MAEQSAQQYLDKLIINCKKSFEKHVITKQEDRRWLIQRLYEDGKPDWTYAAEVIALEGGGLYVGGDIYHIVFAYGPKEPVARVNWVGLCDDIDYYVAQKATIGMGHHYVEEWNSDVAKYELAERIKDDPESYEILDQDAYESALETSEPESFREFMHMAFGSSSYEWVGNVGMVTTGRVVSAWAAVNKLSELLNVKTV